MKPSIILFVNESVWIQQKYPILFNFEVCRNHFNFPKSILKLIICNIQINLYITFKKYFQRRQLSVFSFRQMIFIFWGRSMLELSINSIPIPPVLVSLLISFMLYQQLWKAINLIWWATVIFFFLKLSHF